MQLEIQKYLHDISTAIDSINEYVDDSVNFEVFNTKKILQRAVERELEIIGEAVNRALKIDPDIQITNARRIVNLRNWVIHSYDNVDSVIIWGIVKKDLPVLKHEIHQMLHR